MLLLIVPVMWATGCRGRQPEYRLTATVKDIMDSMIDPIADVLWESVATEVTYAGTEDRQPHTDADWAKVRHAALTIAEATNLLIMPGRKIAKPGERSEHPGIELQPEEIAKIVQEHPEEWVQEARALHDAAMEAMKAIEARNVQALVDAGEKLDGACEQCHLDHWYPSEKKPAAAPSVRK
jgi:hypothetical protein